MKIGIIINTYKTPKTFNNREIMCIESLYKIKEIFPNNVELYNIMFEDEDYILPNFNNIQTLKTPYTKSIGKKLPYINEVFDNACEQNLDYFLFINNDILVSDRFIKHILKETDIDCFIASKLHFTKLNSINDPTSVPESFSVHGFDGFCIKKTWWLSNRSFFKNMLLSRAYWDTYFFTKCMLHGNCKVLNKPPAVIFHLDHKSTSMESDPGNEYNQNIFHTDSENVAQIWYNYVYSVLQKRPSYNNILWYTPFENETELEKKFFKI